MRIINYILCILFILFAAVQYNDPDPFVWICIYLFTSLICFLAARKVYYKQIILAGSILSFIWSVTLAASILNAVNLFGAGSIFSLSMIKDKEVEEARESLGLIIVTIVLVWKYIEAKRLTKT